MSAVIVIRQSDAVHLVCDGASYAPDGTLLGITAKGFALPHLGCAVAFRSGDIRGVALVTDLALAPSYDALRHAAVDLVGEAIREIGAPIELYVGGFSDDGSIDAFAVTSQAVGGASLLSLTEIPGFAVVPCDPPVHAELAFLAGRSPDEIDVYRGARAIIEAQRRHRIRQEDGSEVYGVGGHAMLLTVTRTKVVSEILARWSDEIGRPIDPFATAA
jgi:hypothetical protein